MSIEKKGKSLTGAIVLTAAAAILALSVLQTIVISSSAKGKITAMYEENLDEISHVNAELISSKVEKYVENLERYTKAEVVQEKDDDEIREWLRSQKNTRNPDFDYVAYVDRKANFDSDIGSHASIPDREYYKDIMVRGKQYGVDNPVVSKTTGKLIIHVNSAVDVDGERIGFFSGVMETRHIASAIEDVRIGETGFAMVVSSDGQLIATSGDQALSERIISEGTEKRNKVDKAYWEKHFDGKTRYVITEPIEGTPWTLLIMIEEGQVYETSDAVSRLMIITAVALIVILTLVLGFSISSSLKPLTVVEKTIDEIASGDADLSQRITLKHLSNNEIGRVVNGFNKFIEKLQQIISETKDAKNELDLTGQDLNASTQDTSASITQIIANIQSMETNIGHQGDSVTQTAGAVNEIASNIESLNKMIENQAESVEQASSAIEQMIGNINSVNTNVEKMAVSFEELEVKTVEGVKRQEDVNARIQEVETESQSLKEANAVISSIAEQTNLLAMNAAIEAAHAGEAGKGFSVVADEIRKLSETSSSQSKTIGEQLKRITDSIQVIVQTSKGASNAFNEVSNGINNTNTLVQQIKNAMQEQSEGSKQITLALNSMNDSSMEVKRASEEMEAGNRAILEEIQNLQESSYTMKGGMEEMSIGARKINETGASLSELSQKMDESIKSIGNQVDKFKV